MEVTQIIIKVNRVGGADDNALISFHGPGRLCLSTQSPLKDAVPKLRHSSLLHRAQIGFGIKTKSSVQSQLEFIFNFSFPTCQTPVQIGHLTF